MTDRAPVLNVMIEDYLAHGSSEAEHVEMLKAWMILGAEYMARTAGRQYAIDSIDNLRRFVRDAEPVRPWRP